MSRAVILSAGGDCLLCSFTVDLLMKNCRDEFDSLYICYNNSTDTPKEVQAEFLARYLDDPKIKIIYYPYALSYGLPITKALAVATEDLVCLIEDDGFLVKPGALDDHFKLIENGTFDALGSPRFSCGQEISESLRLKYDLDYSGYGDIGPTWWPNFFFCKRADLLKTDLDFAPKSFDKDVHYPELDHTMAETQSGDTFAWASIQLRYLGLNIGSIPQNHSNPYDIDLFEKKEGKWASEIKYFHGGSLSTGAGQYLAGKLPDVSHDITKQEMESRVAWWSIIFDRQGFDANWDEEWFLGYAQGIKGLILGAELDKDRIDKKIEIYKSLL